MKKHRCDLAAVCLLTFQRVFQVQTEKVREMLWRVSLKAEVEAKISKPSAAWQNDVFCLMCQAVQKAGRT